MEGKDYIKGRGAQYNPQNKFVQDVYGKFHVEAIDSFEEQSNKTIFISSEANSYIVSAQSCKPQMFANPQSPRETISAAITYGT